MGLAVWGLGTSTALHGALILNIILGLDCFGLTLPSWPQVRKGVNIAKDPDAVAHLQVLGRLDLIQTWPATDQVSECFRSVSETVLNSFRSCSETYSKSHR